MHLITATTTATWSTCGRRNERCGCRQSPQICAKSCQLARNDACRGVAQGIVRCRYRYFRFHSLLVPSSERTAATITQISIAKRIVPRDIGLDQIKVTIAIDVHRKKVPRETGISERDRGRKCNTCSS